MTDALFDIPETKSPRLLWIEKHGILTHFAPHTKPLWMALLPLPTDKGKTIGDVIADNCRTYDDADSIGYGDTEDEAITQLALNLGIKMWFEEGMK